MKKRKTLRNVLALLILLLVFGGAYLLLSGKSGGMFGRGRQPIILELDLDQRVTEDSSDIRWPISDSATGRQCRR